MAAGGAAASLQVLHFFEDIGLPIIEGYGLSETAPTVTAGSIDWENRRLGCVGVPIGGIEVKIVDPGTLEVLPNDTDGEVSSQSVLLHTQISDVIFAPSSL
jgi:long-subunit acyl-CoA synthetase (AMP-forming)